MTLKKILVIAISAISLFALIFLFKGFIMVQPKLSQANNHVQDQVFFGYSLGMSNANYLQASPILFIDDIEDELIVSFYNFSGANAEFVLKLFYNYEEINFKVANSKTPTFNNKYIFYLENNQTVEIPIVLDPSLQIENGQLVLMSILAPNSFQKYSKYFYDNYYGLAVRYYIFYKPTICEVEEITNVILNTFKYDKINWTPPLKNEKFKSIETPINENYFAFNISTSINKINYKYPLAYIIAKPNEEIIFYYKLGDITGGFTNRFVILGLLNWEQTKLNEETFLKVKLGYDNETENIMAGYGSFKITAPPETGKYEFIVYAIGVGEYVDIFTNIDNSFRITIVIE